MTRQKRSCCLMLLSLSEYADYEVQPSCSCTVPLDLEGSQATWLHIITAKGKTLLSDLQSAAETIASTAVRDRSWHVP